MLTAVVSWPATRLCHVSTIRRRMADYEQCHELIDKLLVVEASTLDCYAEYVTARCLFVLQLCPLCADEVEADLANLALDLDEIFVSLDGQVVHEPYRHEGRKELQDADVAWQVEHALVQHGQ